MWRTLCFVLGALRQGAVARKSFEQIKALQDQRLRSLVAAASKRSPFYAERLRGVDSAHFKLSDLPTVTKSQMMAGFDQVLTDRTLQRGDLEAFLGDPSRLGHWYRGKYALCRTSGTQGEAALIVQDRAMIDLLFGLQMTRGTVLPCGPLSVLPHLMSRPRMAAVTAGWSFGPSAVSLAYAPPATSWFLERLWLHQLEPLEQAVGQLNRFQPHVLLAYAGLLEILAREALAGRLRLTCLRQLTSISEPLSAGARRLIAEAFNLPVSDCYAAGECLALSSGCPQGHGIHLHADWAILEVVDRNNRPVEPGRPGDKVLLTNLYNTVQPFIRYELTDVVTMSPTPCPCGSPWPLILRVEGRTEEVVWIQAGEQFRQVHPYVFLDVLNVCPALGKYQIIQRRRNHFLIRAAPAPGRDLNRAELLRILREGLQQYELAELMQFDVEIAPGLGPDPASGKLKRIISEVGPPHAS